MPRRNHPKHSSQVRTTTRRANRFLQAELHSADSLLSGRLVRRNQARSIIGRLVVSEEAPQLARAVRRLGGEAMPVYALTHLDRGEYKNNVSQRELSMNDEEFISMVIRRAWLDSSTAQRSVTLNVTGFSEVVRTRNGGNTKVVRAALADLPSTYYEAGSLVAGEVIGINKFFDTNPERIASLEKLPANSRSAFLRIGLFDKYFNLSSLHTALSNGEFPQTVSFDPIGIVPDKSND